MTTPSNRDLFTRIMVDMWDEREYIAADVGFQSIFGRPGSKTVFADNDEVVEFDTIKGNKETAKLVMRGSYAQSLGSTVESLNEQKFTNLAMTFPLADERGEIGADQVLNRIAGESELNRYTKAQRAQILAMKIATEQTRRLVDLHERLAVQMVRTGKQDYILGTSSSDLQLDLGRTAGNTISVSNKWNTSNGTVDADIDAGCTKVVQNGHMAPDVGIVGGGAMTALRENADVQAVADNRRFGFIRLGVGESAPSNLAWMVDAGFTYQGQYITGQGRQLSIFTYDRFYESSGTATAYMTTSEMIIFSSKARCDRYFGPSDWMPSHTAQRQFYIDVLGMDPMSIPGLNRIKNPGAAIDPRMFHHRMFPDPSNTVWTVQTQTAPLFATTHADAFAVLNTLV